MREADYIRAVDARLRTDNENLRARLLHQNVRYVSLLPFDGDWLTPPERCERLARMLTFHLGERSFCARQPELSRAFQWLYGILLYLETQCPPSDQTFQGILKLARLGQDVRENLQPLRGEYFQYEKELRVFRYEKQPPALFDWLEIVFLSVSDYSLDDLEQLYTR